MTTGARGDSALLQKISEYKPDIIYLIIYKIPGKAYNVLEFSTLEKIKNEFKIPMVALFGDLAWSYGKLESHQVAISKTLIPYVTLIVATELTSTLSQINRPDKYIYTWVPKDPRIFNNPNRKRDTEVGYFGSPRKYRMSYVSYLIRHVVKVSDGGLGEVWGRTKVMYT